MRFAGTNTWYLFDPNIPVEFAIEGLDRARSLGFNVVRAMAFPEFRDQDLHRFRALLDSADHRGIKVILPLINNWNDNASVSTPDYGNLGGMDRITLQCSPRPKSATHVEFYNSKNECIEKAYREWIDLIVPAFRDHPAILAWELANEPRCDATKDGNGLPEGNACRASIKEWVDTWSKYIANIDRNHLVAVGDEGFSKKDSPTKGLWMEEVASMPAVWFLTTHFYENGAHSVSLESVLNTAEKLAQAAKKPFVLEEFGSKRPGRACTYKAWLEDATRRESAGGWLFWQLLNATSVSQDSEDYFEFSTDDVISVLAQGSKAFRDGVGTSLVCKPHFFAAPANAQVGAVLSSTSPYDGSILPIQLIAGERSMPTTLAAISLIDNDEGAVMSGTLTVVESKGVATFKDLTIDRPGTYRLQAFSIATGNILSQPFQVIGAPTNAGSCAPGKLRFEDKFDATSIGASWTPIGGSWTQAGGYLTGFWGGDAHADQAQILLDQGQYSRDGFVAEFTLSSANPDGKFVLYSSSGNKYNLNFGNRATASGGYVNIEYRSGGTGRYTTLINVDKPPAYSTTQSDVVSVRKNGPLVTLFVNGTKVSEFTDTLFNGSMMLGLGAYLTMQYDRFLVCDL